LGSGTICASLHFLGHSLHFPKSRELPDRDRFAADCLVSQESSSNRCVFVVSSHVGKVLRLQPCASAVLTTAGLAALIALTVCARLSDRSDLDLGQDNLPAKFLEFGRGVTSSASASPGFERLHEDPRASSSRMSSTRRYVEMVASAVFGALSRKTVARFCVLGSSACGEQCPSAAV
jgi:hypothetical protein